ncbi:AhpC/TSA family protein [Leeuwenhoekiella aestuarii]|uniref:AhpC/TSA family protein n=1 Tax=Leeuwenhoekiella aestuarii TaxID=2249426 RepID=A0A4V1KP03_9FLAO|nr:thioredoxin family protein [Leeuwenhoekiella aestuarii]RXG13081.1 AhpC/TSA family protein [Leeuwenhoekiella aestuarii]
MKTLKLLIGLTSLLVVSAFAFAGFGDFANGYDLGDAVSDFKLQDVSGKQVSLSDFPDAKGIIVVFTCNTCPFALANEARILALDQKYKSKGFPVLAINPNSPELKAGEDFEAMQARAAAQGYTFPYLYDESHTVYSQFGATKTPHIYLLNREENELVVRYIGAIDNSVRDASTVTKRFVEQAVEALLNAEAVEPAITKAIGCSIKA